MDENGNPASQPGNNWFVGKPIRVLYNYQTDGIFQYDDFDISDDGTGGKIYTLKPTIDTDGDGIADKALEYGDPQKPGFIKIRDTNGDGKINDDDRIQYNRDPDFTMSLSTTLRWKGLEFYMDWYGVSGGYVLNDYLYAYNKGGSLNGKLNGIKVNYWTPTNPGGTFQRPGDTGPASAYRQAIAIQDASYIRLRTLQLGYNFPDKLFSKVGIRKLRIYATATNLLTFTDVLSYSPELLPGEYPEPQTFVFGVNFSF